MKVGHKDESGTIRFNLMPGKVVPKVRFVVCDNGFSQIFYSCSNVDLEEIFSWHS